MHKRSHLIVHMLCIWQPCWLFKKLEFTKHLSFLENQPPFFGVGHPQKGDTLVLFVDRWDRVGCWSLISCMTRFKQNKFYKSSKINGNYVAVPLSSDKTTSQIDQGLDQLTKGKEALRWERIGLLEDCWVQENIFHEPLRSSTNSLSNEKFFTTDETIIESDIKEREQ